MRRGQVDCIHRRRRARRRNLRRHLFGVVGDVDRQVPVVPAAAVLAADLLTGMVRRRACFGAGPLRSQRGSWSSGLACPAWDPLMGSSASQVVGAGGGPAARRSQPTRLTGRVVTRCRGLPGGTRLGSPDRGGAGVQAVERRHIPQGHHLVIAGDPRGPYCYGASSWSTSHANVFPKSLASGPNKTGRSGHPG